MCEVTCEDGSGVDEGRVRQWEGRCEGLGEYSSEEFINLHLYRLENEYQKDCDCFEEYLK